ncbi:RidA family protein [Roseibium sp. RKSG952]|uniref:RidA family protein n=1 Tax=Roseibium sp. RKSG952 TaxID=2529384 RepID=UPI0012BC8514|nr:RidA family protein [Roseibium sp. RKSG952]MTH95651.1 RidA family protein [Roseibium sp. RKSG952]
MASSYNPPNIWQPFGAFSQLVVTGSGQLVFLKGQVALGTDGEVIGEGEMEVQVRQVLQNISDSLVSVGGKMSDVVSLQQFTTDIKGFMGCGAIRNSFFKPPFPVTTTLEVSALYDPRLLVEITSIAEVPMDRFVLPGGAEALHR